MAELRKRQAEEHTAELKRHTAELKRQAQLQKQVAKQQSDSQRKHQRDMDRAAADHRKQLTQQQRDMQRMNKQQQNEAERQWRAADKQRRKVSADTARQRAADAAAAKREAAAAKQDKNGFRENLPSRKEAYGNIAGGFKGAATGGLKGAREGGWGDFLKDIAGALGKGPLPAKALAALLKTMELASRVLEYTGDVSGDAGAAGSEIYNRTRAAQLETETVEENLRLNRDVVEQGASMRLTLDRAAINWTKTVTDGMGQMFDRLSVETGFKQDKVTSELIDAVGDIHVQTGMSLDEVGSTIKRLSQVTGKDQIAAIQDLSGVVRMTGFYSNQLFKRGIKEQALTAADMMESVLTLTDGVDNFSGDASDYAEQVGRLSSNMRVAGASYEHSRKMTEQMVKALSTQTMSNEYASSVQASPAVQAAIAGRLQELKNKVATGKATGAEKAQLDQGRLMQEAKASGAPSYVLSEMFRSFAASSTKVQAAAFDDVMKRSGATKVGDSVGYIASAMGASDEAVLRLQREWIANQRSSERSVGGFGGKGGLPTDRRTQASAAAVKYSGADLKEMTESTLASALAGFYSDGTAREAVTAAMDAKQFAMTEIAKAIVDAVGSTGKLAPLEAARREQAVNQAPSTMTNAPLTGQVTNVSPNGAITIVIPNMGAALGTTPSQIRAQAGNK